MVPNKTFCAAHPDMTQTLGKVLAQCETNNELALRTEAKVDKLIATSARLDERTTRNSTFISAVVTVILNIVFGLIGIPRS